jgi:DNA-directed RNA polymerase
MQNVTTVKANPNREYTFSKVLARSNRGDEKLIDVIKLFICNITQRKVNFKFLDNFLKQLGNLWSVLFVTSSKNLANSSSIHLGLLQISANIFMPNTMCSTQPSTVMV